MSFLDGDVVKGVGCPKCKNGFVLYNGNYFCSDCNWAMPEKHSKADDEIIKTYLIQRRDSTTDIYVKNLMTHYLERYQ